MSESESYRYRALAAGVLNFPRNRANDRNRLPQLQMVGPLGGNFGLPIRLTRQAPGYELLDPAAHGARLRIEGSLEWSAAAGEISPLPALLVDSVRMVTAAEEDGCDIWLYGEVIAPPRISRHPLRTSVALAQVAVRVQFPRTRHNSRVTLTETVRIPLAIPLNHAEAPALFRPGNRVAVEGMLERAPLLKSGPEVEQALAELDAATRARLASISDPADIRAVERAAERRRWDLTHQASSRVVAGFVQLLEGAPATIREARALRRAAVRGHAQPVDHK